MKSCNHVFDFYLPSGTVGDKLSALLERDLNLTAGDAGPSDRSAHQVPVLIDGVGLYCRPDEVFHKLCAQIFDKNLARNRHTQTGNRPPCCMT